MAPFPEVRTPEVIMTIRLTRALQILRGSERGATAVEYGLMVALIAIVVIGAVSLLGENVSSIFATVTGRV
jgi:pilus assembly protein Flp/PilA